MRDRWSGKQTRKSGVGGLVESKTYNVLHEEGVGKKKKLLRKKKIRNTKLNTA